MPQKILNTKTLQSVLPLVFNKQIIFVVKKEHFGALFLYK